MQIIFQCPKCQASAETRPVPASAQVGCSQCDWTRDEGSSDFDGEYVSRCRICGCQDLWRQKDFPPLLGLFFVGMGILFSSLAWMWYYPAVALGVLMGFALIDMLLYAFMGDMLVCYRCRARHRKTAMQDDHASFDLEVSERYVQMARRQDENSPPAS